MRVLDPTQLVPGNFEGTELEDPSKPGETMGCEVRLSSHDPREVLICTNRFLVQQRYGVTVACNVYPTPQANFEVASRLFVAHTLQRRELMLSCPVREDLDGSPVYLTDTQEDDLAYAARNDYKWEGHYRTRERFEKGEWITDGRLGVWDLTKQGKKLADWCLRKAKLSSTRLEILNDVPEALRLPPTSI